MNETFSELAKLISFSETWLRNSRSKSDPENGWRSYDEKDEELLIEAFTHPFIVDMLRENLIPMSATDEGEQIEVIE